MAPNHDQIRALEQIGFRAWPALEAQDYDGWLLRFADSYSKRNNSINPMQAGVGEIAMKVAHCEDEYMKRGHDVHFRLTEASLPSHLDTFLEQSGYRRWDETEVQTTDLMQQDVAQDARFRWELEPSSAWITAYSQMNGVSEQRQATLAAILNRIEPVVCFGWLGERAVGLGVCEGDYLGLFDIVVDREQRQQGLGRALVTSLLAWGRDQGAQTAYLQVVATNLPAMRLYQSLGFRLHHRYWYRTKGFL